MTSRLPSFRGRVDLAIDRVLLGSMLALVVLVSVWTPLHAQVAPLGHPSVEERIESLDADPSQGFRFVVFGDQKNLWGDEFPKLLDQIRAESQDDLLDLLFMVDTGDIVDDGSKAEQFEELRGHLARVAELPYLVGVGNHELQPERGTGARARAHRNTVAFLGDDYAEPRMFFAERVGPVRLLFLNTNDLPGVYPKLRSSDPAAEERAAAQLRWLEAELREEVHPTIVISHHALVQSPSKHRGHANALWNHAYEEHGGRTLPEILIDGGVDLILSGHVHSYEVFRLERDGRRIWSVNASGKPTGIWRPGTRMPRNWQGRELERLENRGFTTRLDQWTVDQLAFMTDETKRNQFAMVTVDEVGTLELEIRSVDGSVLFVTRIPASPPDADAAR